MYIKAVDIKNFKGITGLKMDFQSGFNLIKGENGKGKTSVLEAIAVGLGGYIEGIDGVPKRNISKDEIRYTYALSGEGSCNQIPNMPVEIQLQTVIDGTEYCWSRKKNSINAPKSTVQPRDIVMLAEKMSASNDTELPILRYQGAERILSQKHDKLENIFSKKYIRTVGYIDALKGTPDIKLIRNWCLKMELVAFQKKNKVAEYEAVKKAISDFMQYMNPGRRFEVFYDSQLEEIMYKDEETILPVYNLSAGYQSLIWIAFDIAYRMCVLNPGKKECITETKGIVLIDEIDMHLHPKWQWRIIDALTTVFPNVQFIASTHAPILFASAKEIWIIDIDADTVLYSKSHYGIDINTALKEYQETGEMAEAVKIQVDKFLDALDDENYEMAQNILDGLEQETAPEHPILLNLRTRLEIETMPLEE